MVFALGGSSLDLICASPLTLLYGYTLPRIGTTRRSQRLLVAENADYRLIKMLGRQSSKRNSLRTGGASSSGEITEERDMMIPEEIIQEIFSRMPFPEILKVREISKCWNAYFQNELKPKLPAPKPPQQPEVVSESIFTWARYYPFSIKLYENQLFYDSDT
ncbi:hypothetical protein R1sor_017636 [Riccia sorocarpa]|uniref:F-box domain-containing protein n=1 Tax=Riccia sorocarpa TaxID=122646 RepID=A0ABD3IAR0_9MARC